MLVSIIIPAHNAAATLAECLEACLGQTYAERELIVVDDGSTDETSRIAESYPVHCVRQEQRGPAAARNRGAREARSIILAYTDADCIPEPEWVERLVAGFEEGVVAVGGTYGIANESNELARMIHEEIMIRHQGFSEEVDFLGSYNAAYRRDAFERAGGFDEGFTAASGEDNDLAYRLADAGGQLRFVRDAMVAHYHPTRLLPYLKTQMRHGFWRVRIYVKHPKRTKGDRYAGLFDLLAPALIMASFVFLSISIIWTPGGLLTAITVLTALFLVAFRFVLPWRMMRRSGDPRMLLFGPVMLARDAARALGMIHGIWTFVVLKKVSA